MPGSITCFQLLDALAYSNCHIGQKWLCYTQVPHTIYGTWRLYRMTCLQCSHKLINFNSFLSQVTSSSSKGPCFLTHDRANKATQIHTAKAYMAEFSNKHAHSKVIEENTNPQVFVPSSGARHRPVKTKTGKEGTFL